ncbi:hypothetical protein MKK69_22850 [Methylobacterium sp. J-026]|jgi:hypothetical protein|uniref:hypothetical protein n=1 Tax=unclassified Methylobacterium TaxID=2615210 RepID=UPI0011C9F517|nr:MULTISPECIES: hypothetical protein [unclassified Methylobacterium]MCJ2136854.1 hypothetical protein [Methylobacterium sp. J-026]TXM71118.1 hypothetical protein FV229_00100 [Methylobacterium sp. WL120]
MTETRERLTPEERAGRQRRLMTVGEYLYGPSWQNALATRLEKRGPVAVPRVRLNQWANGAKPVPGWMLPVIETVAREAAAELRQRALVLDAIAAGGDAPPGAPGEPEGTGDSSVETGSTVDQGAAGGAGEAFEFSMDTPVSPPGADEPEFDIGAFVDTFVQTYAHVPLPR